MKNTRLPRLTLAALLGALVIVARLLASGLPSPFFPSLRTTAPKLTGSVPPADASSTAQPGSAFHVRQRCPTPTAGGSETWKTYNSAPYRYSIGYPPTAQVIEQTPANVSIRFTESFSLDTGAIEDEFDFTITAYENSTRLTPNQWAKSHPPAAADIRNPRTVKLNGLSAYQVSGWEIDHTTVYLFVNNGLRMYVLSFPDPSLSPDLEFPKALQARYADVFAQMLCAFRLRQ